MYLSSPPGTIRVDSLLNERKQLALTCVEQQGCLVDDEILIEAEVAGASRDGDRRVDPVDAAFDFVNVGARLAVRDHGCCTVGVERPSACSGWRVRGSTPSRQLALTTAIVPTPKGCIPHTLQNLCWAR